MRCASRARCRTGCCFFDQGRIVEEGEPERIFTAPKEERTREFLRSVLGER